MARRVVVERLEEHPNLDEILAVLAQLPHVGDNHLRSLAGAWRNSDLTAGARSGALSPDSPLVVEVLSAFDAVSALFADDVMGVADYIIVEPEVTIVALKAVRDAIAGAYARPALSRAGYAALMRPWRTVFERAQFREPDLGPDAAQVRALLSTLPTLAARCHDEQGRTLFDSLVDRTWAVDHEAAGAARDEAFRAAVLTSRRRVWTLVRRTAAESIGRRCLTCTEPVQRRDEQRVLALCADAACALLVADTLDERVAQVLTAPLASLLPSQRGASEA